MDACNAAIWMTTSAMNGMSVSVIILLLYAYNNTAKMRGGEELLHEYNSDLNDNICDEWEDEKVEDMQHGRANWMRGGWGYATG